MTIIRTHYDNLKVSREAPMVVINAAYKALCQIYHPDKFQVNNQEAERIFKIIIQSYAVLSDPIKKAEHDQWIDAQEKHHKQGFASVSSTEKDSQPKENSSGSFNENAGSSWKNTYTGTANNHENKDSSVFIAGNKGPGGGIVFYVDSSGLHGLEAQPDDYNKEGLNWFEAMTAAGSYGPGWRLPTKEELNLLYREQVVVGGFSNGSYWSSTKSVNTNAWTQYFSNGYQYDYNSNLRLLVRGVSAF